MQIDGFDIIAPGLSPEPWSQAQALGCVTWLWMHSAAHRDTPLHGLPTLLMPALLSRQFVVATLSDRPIFYMSWAMLSEEAEGRYLRNSPILMPQADWTSGDRMWITDWVAPFGHTSQMSKMILRQLMPHSCMRSLNHHGGDPEREGLRVNTFRGRLVSRRDAREWWQARPLATNIETSPHQQEQSVTALGQKIAGTP
ncbi:MAG: toxin-activating lysine-acyltransferase [Aquabacterium sp.]|uniref:toxin-activating lysine-acyltransferase n=1 Tax=Aquabacterium sp. TaxID=1872578 RepID=UPI0011FFFAB3|nr:toxin-activating lysine-acyltransferase [Aquabacterium sp.]TAK91618.1 MAG: toxin-activating lysine-acyltransferase [Aquabacterium sp.]